MFNSYSRKFVRAAAGLTLAASLIWVTSSPSVIGAEPVIPQESEATAPSPAPESPVPAVCAESALTVALGSRLDIPGKYGMDRSAFTYAMKPAKFARVTDRGLVIPLAAGGTVLSVGTADPSTGSLTPLCDIPVTVRAADTPKSPFTPKVETRKVKSGSKTFSVQMVTLPKGMPADVSLAGGKVGGVEDLKDLATRSHADAAVNGTFFEAYGGIPEPWDTIIQGGQIAHLSNKGTTIGFTADGIAKMDSLRIKIEGSIGGSDKWPNNWYAYFFNRTPSKESNAATLFTSKRGSKIGFAYGTSIVVNAGIIEKIAANENVAIPQGGFVLVLTGTETKQAERFEVGKTAAYRVRYLNAEGQPIDWGDVVTAVGAGPRVLKDGKVAVDAKKEGFTQEKIISLAAARSGIGIRKDGSVVVVTVGKATVRELGDILKAVGAVQGMNLDGGASSGLFAKGKMLTKPGRLISNSLVFGANLKFAP